MMNTWSHKTTLQPYVKGSYIEAKNAELLNKDQSYKYTQQQEEIALVLWQ